MSLSFRVWIFEFELWSDQIRTKGNVTITSWDLCEPKSFDCLHFVQYILIGPHGIDCKQIWCKNINHTNWCSCCAGLWHFIHLLRHLTWHHSFSLVLNGNACYGLNRALKRSIDHMAPLVHLWEKTISQLIQNVQIMVCNTSWALYD